MLNKKTILAVSILSFGLSATSKEDMSISMEGIRLEIGGSKSDQDNSLSDMKSALKKFELMEKSAKDNNFEMLKENFNLISKKYRSEFPTEAIRKEIRDCYAKYPELHRTESDSIAISSYEDLNKANELNDIISRINKSKLSYLLEQRKEISTSLKSLLKETKIPHILDKFLKEDNFSEGIYPPIRIMRPMLSFFFPNRNPSYIQEQEQKVFELLENLSKKSSLFFSNNETLAKYKNNLKESLECRTIISSAGMNSDFFDYLDSNERYNNLGEKRYNDDDSYDITQIKRYFKLHEEFLNSKESLRQYSTEHPHGGFLAREELAPLQQSSAIHIS